MNTLIGQSYLVGPPTASGPKGTLTLRYNGQADLTSGRATRRFVSVSGTGQFATLLEREHYGASDRTRHISPPTPALLPGAVTPASH